VECPNCKKLIEKLPCPHCGYDEAEAVEKGGTGGGRPGN